MEQQRLMPNRKKIRLLVSYVSNAILLFPFTLSKAVKIYFPPNASIFKCIFKVEVPQQHSSLAQRWQMVGIDGEWLVVLPTINQQNPNLSLCGWQHQQWPNAVFMFGSQPYSTGLPVNKKKREQFHVVDHSLDLVSSVIRFYNIFN